MRVAIPGSTTFAGRAACAFLLMCAEPPASNEIRRVSAGNVSECELTPEELWELEGMTPVGESVEWPFGPPILRTAMMGYTIYDDDGYPMPRPLDNAPDVIEISLHELRRRRRGKQEAVRAAVQEKLCSEAGLTVSEVQRCFHHAPRLTKQPAKVVSERLDLLRATGLPPAAMKKLVLGAPSLLLHTNLNETLAEKLRVLTSATGLPVDRAVSAAPALLLLESGTLGQRLGQLQSALPEVDLPVILRRAPRLLGLRAESLRMALDELTALLAPLGADAADVVQRQPTLLATSRAKLATKLGLLRELCDESEWQALLLSASFGRTLTASVSVIERLRHAPRPADGEPRGVVKILLMSKAEHADFAQLANVAAARPGPQPGPLRWAAGRGRGRQRST